MAAALLSARDELAALVEHCNEAQWASCPLETDGDPRATRVITDHVAEAYRYIGGWIRELVAGGTVEVDASVVDGLNAQHEARAASIGKAEVLERLRVEGDAFADLLRSLSGEDLTKGDGRVGRLAQIGVRHTVDHRRDLAETLGAPS